MDDQYDQKLGFNEVKIIFESHEKWCGGIEIFWYEMAWKCLDRANLTKYKDLLELCQVYIRAFTLIMLYYEFCYLELEEPFSYEFFRDDCEDILSDFILGQLIMKCQYEFNNLPNRYCSTDLWNNEDIDLAFNDLIKDKRYEVFDAIRNNIDTVNYLKDFTIFIAMYITAITLYENSETETLVEINSYEDYNKAINKFFDEITDSISEDDEAFNWILEGTYGFAL